MLQEAPKKVYVPAPRVGVAAKKPERSKPPAELARHTAGVAFRAIPWGGTPIQAEAPRAERRTMTAPAAEERCGTFFLNMPWTGEKPAPATVAQSATSVRSILDKFRWE